jgi:HK97 family phage prohead protease
VSEHSVPPRENLIRAVLPGVEFRTDDDDHGRPVLYGHFARFNEWTEINSAWEGRFMERFVPGAFKKTLREQGDRLRVLFQHGHDPEIGDKPIAELSDVREDDEGAYYEARLFDGLPPLIMDGLRAGQYGASFRFSVMREELRESPEPSEQNPNGLPERTVKEARVPEFGPVTFPAYAGATAGVRSMTDDFIQSCIRSDPERFRLMLETATDLSTPDEQDEQQDAPSEDNAATRDDGEHLADERRVTENTKPTLLSLYGRDGRRSTKEQRSWHRR